MSCKPQDEVENKPKKIKKFWVKCCPKDIEAPPKPKPLVLLPIKPIVCKPIEKPAKKPKTKEEPKCEKPRFYRPVSEQRAYLEQQVVPILMEGMLAVAREQPRDPIMFLEKFWLQEQHKCDIPLPKDLL